MSGGGGGDRDDLTSAVGGSLDQCTKSYESPINSPKPSVLEHLSEGDTLLVDVATIGSSTSLVVKDASGEIAGALTFVGYLQVINCITQKGVEYTAKILSIHGGMYKVKVSPS